MVLHKHVVFEVWHSVGAVVDPAIANGSTATFQRLSYVADSWHCVI